MNLKPVDDNTPKNRTILAWCDHDADPYQEADRLTPYAAWCESCGEHAVDGFSIVEWGGGYYHSNAPEGPEERMPNWWFVNASDFETPANPVAWCELPPDWKEAP